MDAKEIIANAAARLDDMGHGESFSLAQQDSIRNAIHALKAKEPKRVRYIIPRDVNALFSMLEKGADRVSGFHNNIDSDSPTFCNIIETTTNKGVVRYKVRISLANGEIIEGWTPGSGLDPVVYDPNNDLLDGRFNL